MNGDESFLAYTLEWSRAVYCRGLFEISVDTVAADPDVQFIWALLSSDIKEEENAIHLLKTNTCSRVIVNYSWIFCCFSLE